MKINIACPTTGGQKVFDIDDEKKLRIFMELRISDEVDASPLGDEFKGYILRITGGNDKDGFPMKQGVLVNHRVRLLLRPGTVGFRRGLHDGVRKRRTVRGCIVANDLSVLNTIVVKKGEQEIPGLTDKVIPRRVGPKRASKIRKLFNLSYLDDVRKYVIARRRPNKKEGGEEHTKKPKVQRIVTSRTLQHRRAYQALRKATHLHRMYMLQRAIAQKRTEKYLRKQRHLANLKYQAEHRKERVVKKLTPEEIERKKKNTAHGLRMHHHRKALLHKQAVRRAVGQQTFLKQELRHAEKVLAKPNLRKSVRGRFTQRKEKLQAQVKRVPEILRNQPPSKKAKVEKKVAAKK